jgi:hypothetical protein
MTSDALDRALPGGKTARFAKKVLVWESETASQVESGAAELKTVGQPKILHI